MCAPQEPPHHFTVVLSDMIELNENTAFVNPVDFGNFDNFFVDGVFDDVFDDVFDSPPLDSSFDSMDYDPSLFDLLFSYELPPTPIASNLEPPPYSETSLVDWEDIVVGGLSDDGSTYTPTFPAYDHFLNWSPPSHEAMWLNLEDVGGGLSTPIFAASDHLAPRALDAPYEDEDEDEDDLLDALDALYEPDDEERRGFKRKLGFD